MIIFTLYAHRTDFEHEFTEHFTSISNLEQYLTNHPEVQKDGICEFELDPK